MLLSGEVGAVLLLKPAETTRLHCRGERQEEEEEEEREDAEKSPHMRMHACMHRKKEESRSSKRVAIHDEGCICWELQVMKSYRCYRKIFGACSVDVVCLCVCWVDTVGLSSCVLVRPRSSWHRGGARLDGRNPRVRLERSAASVVDLGSGIIVSARVESCKKVWSGGAPDVTSPTVKLVRLSILRSPLRRGARAFIVKAMRLPYLRSSVCLLLTVPSYFVATFMVLAARCAACFLPLGNVGLAPLTLVGSAVRRPTLPCLCQASSNHVGSTTSLGQLSGDMGMWQPGQHPSYHTPPPSPEKTFSRLLIRVLKMRSCNEPSGRSEGRLVSNPDEQGDLGHKSWDLTERVTSGTNLGDLVERVVPGTNPGDLAERVISGTNLGDLAERVVSGTNLGDLAERGLGHKSWGFGREGDLGHKSWGFGRGDTCVVGMTSSDSSSSVRVISSPGSGGVSQSDPEASPLGVSSGPPSPVDSRALRDWEVMKADHDLDTVVTEGSLVVIRERYSIPAEYGLHVP
ncbi:hypothetical protein BHE74_00058333 [Ensete ventricosum]|nr:hypothetical protein BHE74_00058333 [Ensete ventricosum]